MARQFTHFTPPVREDYRTEEEYEEAYDIFEGAEMLWEDEYHERCLMAEI